MDFLRAGRALESLLPRESYFTAGQTFRRAYRRFVAEAVTRTSVRCDPHRRSADPIGDSGPQKCPPIVYARRHNCEYAPLPSTRRTRTLSAAPPFLLFDAERRPRHRDRARAQCCARDRVLRGRRPRTIVQPIVEWTASRAVVVPNGVDVARYEPVVLAAVGTRNDLDLRKHGLAAVPTGPSMVFERRFAGARAAGKACRILGARRGPDDRCAAARDRGVPRRHRRAESQGHARRTRPFEDRRRAEILASSGTRLRILEAWAAGRPVVADACRRIWTRVPRW